MDRNPDPLKHEDRFFQEQDRLALEKLRKRREERLQHDNHAQESKRLEELKAAHWMCCPKCGHGMEEVDMAGVLVDRCTRCEGIYLDRGELEDIFLKKQEDRRTIFRKILGI